MAAISRTALLRRGFVLLFLLCSAAATRAQTATSGIRVTLPEAHRDQPVNGRLLLFFSSSPQPEPRFGPSIFNPEPVYAVDVTNWSGEHPTTFEPGQFAAPAAKAFPKPLSELAPDTYFVQVLLDRDTTRRSYAAGPGNLYSDVVEVSYDPTAGGHLTLPLQHVVTPDTVESTPWVKRVEIASELLSEFHGETVRMRAGVILPPGYEEDTSEQYPTVYVIPGFGGRHTEAWEWIDSPAGRAWKQGDWPMSMIRVVLDPDTPLGHSTFANSANNGPVGDALVRELIPAIDEQYRTVAEPHGRFLRGHSSGGWTSLWLQITYPAFFGGAWSTAPDPVDFRAFQVVDIYEDENAYWAPDGHPYPSIRNHGDIILTIRDENRMEYVTGPGGQWGSWHAVFGPRASSGQPVPLWNALTGDIKPEVAEYWKRYDIRRILEENWSTLAPALEGKLHVVGGAEDNYYLNRSLALLKQFLSRTDYGGYVEIRPGDHGSFLDAELRRQFYRQMKTRFEEGK